MPPQVTFDSDRAHGGRVLDDVPATDTDLLRHTNPEAALTQVAGMTPLGRLGQPDDIADIVALLASHEGRWLTDQVIHATGGLA